MPPVSRVAPFEAAVRQHKPSLRQESPHHDFSAGAQGLIESYRLHGYYRASVNPLDEDVREASLMAELNPWTYGLDLNDPASYRVQFGGSLHTLTLSDLVTVLQKSYCGSISLETAHIRSLEQRRWLYAQMETRGDAAELDDPEALRILERLAAAEVFEHFFRANCAGYKQFSLEGSESFVVLLRAVVDKAAQQGIDDLVLGMPHRGRLNLMLNALDVPARELMTLFSSRPERSLAAGDIKDHAGFWRHIVTEHGGVRVLLARNPSHLESVCPVICGMARALQDRKPGGMAKKVLPVLVHGDGSFSGQGIVTETLNLSQTRGYGVGGTVHLLLNNQIGSTVSHPRDARSTLYGADIARGVDAPVIHVNADDPEAVVFAADLAIEYRMRFGADIVVDQIGYRRFGHFVGDDPTFTQPVMQRRIAHHRSVTEIYSDRLSRRGFGGRDALDRMKADALATMTTARAASSSASPAALERTGTEPEETRRVRTAVPETHLRPIVARLAASPAGYTLHPRVEEMRCNWHAAATDADPVVDWRLAENLAYATLLVNGFNIRVSGLDVGRGTFCHRQHVWHDQGADADWQKLHVPLRHVADGQGAFSIYESPLSEEAVLGFEYGYAVHCGRDLVVWEAQFGDFVNNAQVIIDQYIATGESKWDYESGIVMMLPHGYDGWGPEHSSAYLGRFLQLCAAGNLRVAMPSTAAQCYHLLRRQALMQKRKPLIVMTPKPWLYACQQSWSRLRDLATEEFQPLLREAIEVDPVGVTRVIVTSGKVYYDLAAERAKGASALPMLRVEELYPFPVTALREELTRWPNLREVVWAQEEARNHGAWHLVREELESALPAGVALLYAGRPDAAPTAVCDPARHAAERQELVAKALAPAS